MLLPVLALAGPAIYAPITPLRKHNIGALAFCALRPIHFGPVLYVLGKEFGNLEKERTNEHVFNFV